MKNIEKVSCPWFILTSIRKQYVHKKAIRQVPIEPIINPEFLNASGMARIPVPILPLRMCTKVSPFLRRLQNATQSVISDMLSKKTAVPNQLQVLIVFISRFLQQKNSHRDRCFCQTAKLKSRSHFSHVLSYTERSMSLK